MIIAENPYGYILLLVPVLAWIAWMAWKYRNDRYMSDDWIDRHINDNGNYRP